VEVVEPKPTAAEQVLPWTPGTTFAVKVSVGHPLDILLQPGEQVRNIVGGDREPAEQGQPPRWQVQEGAEGRSDTMRPHVFITASTPGLTMGLILTTTKRTYYLSCTSVGRSPVRVVRWTYPPEPAPVLAREPGLLPDPTQPRQYHVGYTYLPSQPPPAWHPRQTVDDGEKTYILLPEVTLFSRVPMLRLVGPQGPMLANVRQFLNVLIVDELVSHAELRVGTGERAETVTIRRGELRTITCPGDPDCPRWPRAAQQLAGR
jgi:type IV secretion system protein VirB9